MGKLASRLCLIVAVAVALATFSTIRATADPPTDPALVPQPTFQVPPNGSSGEPQTSTRTQLGESQASTESFGGGACWGSFTDPIAGYGAFDWGSYIQCNPAKATQMSVRVYKCLWAGANGYDCSYLIGTAGPMAFGYFNSTHVTVPCVSGVGGYFKPELYYLSVDGAQYPGLMGNVQYVDGGTCL